MLDDNFFIAFFIAWLEHMTSVLDCILIMRRICAVRSKGYMPTVTRTMKLCYLPAPTKAEIIMIIGNVPMAIAYSSLLALAGCSPNLFLPLIPERINIAKPNISPIPGIIHTNNHHPLIFISCSLFTLSIKILAKSKSKIKDNGALGND